MNIQKLRLLAVRAFDLPPEKLIAKGSARLGVEVRAIAAKTRARLSSTRTSGHRYSGVKPTPLINSPLDPKLIEQDFKELSRFNDRTLRHEFDLLGSGWTNVRRGLKAQGLETFRYETQDVFPPTTPGDNEWLKRQADPKNRSASIATWKIINDPVYQPIDWHLDFKSGYRWNPRQWWRDVPHAHQAGVDIKVPWELARMQHLPALALEAHTERVRTSNCSERASRLHAECRSQILDFIAQNPPLFGVNWRCAMDVGIRAANCILAVDLFRSAGFEFDSAFYEAFLASLEDHGHFIFHNLEKYPDFRGNHYLANICGLAFISAALPESSENGQRWNSFAKTELVNEVEFQFHSDGSYFEGSTAYHRLASEMVLYTLALLNGEAIRKGHSLKLSSSILNKLKAIKSFTEAVTKPDGKIIQIGDCDSGRFFKVPVRLSSDMTEDHLDHQDLIAIADAFFGKRNATLAGALISSFSNQPVVSVGETIALTFENKNESKETLASAYARAAFKHEYIFKSVGEIQNIRKYEFLEFGLVTFKAMNFFLSFRCGPLGQYGRAGHDHDDQLSIELFIDGKTLIDDPGTYLYTPIKSRRNEYRSIRAHFAPQFEIHENTDLEAGLFYMRRVHPGHITHVSSSEGDKLFSVAGFCERGGGKVYRHIEIEKSRVRIRDWSDSNEIVDLNHQVRPPLSIGYGVRS